MGLAPLFCERSAEELTVELSSCVRVLVSCEELNRRTLPAPRCGCDRRSAAWVQPAVGGITAGLSSCCFAEAPCILYQKLKSTKEGIGRIAVNKLGYLLIL